MAALGNSFITTSPTIYNATFRLHYDIIQRNISMFATSFDFILFCTQTDGKKAQHLTRVASTIIELNIIVAAIKHLIICK